MNPKIYTVKEVAEIFEVTPQTIRNETKRGKLKCFYIGDEARFTMVHLEDYTNVKKLGKTIRETELEKEKEELLEVIKNKNKIIENIKNLILKEAQI